MVPGEPEDRPQAAGRGPSGGAGTPRVATAHHGSNSLLAQEVDDRHPRWPHPRRSAGLALLP